jgi:hypothetical protein
MSSNAIRDALPVFTMVLCACAMDAPADDGASAVSVSRAGLAKTIKADVGRVILCHLTVGGTRHSITTAASAASAHLGHGDTIGECPTGCTGVTDCDDGDPCTADACATDGTCTSAPAECNDGNPCTVDRCDTAMGCVTAAATGTTCDDGNDCTTADACAAGACTGSAVAGCCLADADCADDDGCTEDVCVDRACRNRALDCALLDRCIAGFCDPTTFACDSAPVTCDDADRCTDDSCNAQLGCAHTPIEDCLDTCPQVANLSSVVCASDVVALPESIDLCFPLRNGGGLSNGDFVDFALCRGATCSDGTPGCQLTVQRGELSVSEATLVGGGRVVTAHADLRGAFRAPVVLSLELSGGVRLSVTCEVGVTVAANAASVTLTTTQNSCGYESISGVTFDEGALLAAMDPGDLGGCSLVATLDHELLPLRAQLHARAQEHIDDTLAADVDRLACSTFAEHCGGSLGCGRLP